MSQAIAHARVIHAGCVSFDGRGVLILGASGSGKSSLALQLMAYGFGFVSDDRTAVAARGGIVVAAAPRPVRGRIEARGIGILNVTPVSAARIRLVIDLDEVEGARLPPFRTYSLLGVDLPLLHSLASPHFPAAILQYVKAGRNA